MALYGGAFVYFFGPGYIKINSKYKCPVLNMKYLTCPTIRGFFYNLIVLQNS